MWLTLLAISIGLLVGWALGGTVGLVRNIRLASWPLLAVGLPIQLSSEIIELPFSMALSILSSGLLILFCLRNLRIIGLGVLAVGFAVNVFVSVLNWGMPVNGEALVDANVATAADVASGIEFRGNRHLETNADFFTTLDDRIPVRLMTVVVSFGDLIVLVGLADITANLLLARRQRLIVEGPPRPVGPRRARSRAEQRPDSAPEPEFLPDSDSQPADPRDRELVSID